MKYIGHRKEFWKLTLQALALTPFEEGLTQRNVSVRNFLWKPIYIINSETTITVVTQYSISFSPEKTQVEKRVALHCTAKYTARYMQSLSKFIEHKVKGESLTNKINKQYKTIRYLLNEIDESRQHCNRIFMRYHGTFSITWSK